MTSMRCAGSRTSALPAAGGDPSRPVRDQRHCDAPFVREVLEPAERGAAERGPVHAEIQVRVRPSRRITVEAPVGPFSALAPLSDRKRISVLSRAPRASSSFHQPADARVDGLRSSRRRRPSNGRSGPWASSVNDSQEWRRRVARAERPSAVDQAHRNLAAIARFPQGVPSGLVPAAMLRDHLRRRHQREVRGVVRQV